MDSSWPKEACVDGSAYWRHLANMTEVSKCGSDAAFWSNFFHMRTGTFLFPKKRWV